MATHEGVGFHRIDQCRIGEYDGAYKCYTHKKMWGAVPKPETPCEAWKAARDGYRDEGTGTEDWSTGNTGQ